MDATTEKQHAYIIRTPGTCSGRSRIDGTRIPVWLVAAAVVYGGQTPDELAESYPHLTLAQIHDALSYFYDHRDEIEADLREQDAAWPASRRQNSR